ncbi:phosphoglycolate phosphatase [Ramlibacter sp. PS3R-8]|uniref:phosphoglycolate phosphatase n=1 Tax=Ramlibacter sp. PS3R-8 TaxID=3133437 RepID=UPI0030AFD0F8
MDLVLRDRTVAIDAALFDLDGTLVHSLGDFAVALGALMDDLELPAIDASEVAPLLGKGVDHLVHTVLARVVGEQHAAEMFPRAKPIYWRHYVAVNGRHSEVYAGVHEALERLHAGGVQLACVTNKPMAFARPLLQAMGLDGRFPVVSAGDSHPRMKPDPMPLLVTCDRLGVVPSRTLMVGDSTNDSIAARAAGCPVALMRYGYNHGVPVDQVDCDAALDDLNELFGPRAGHASFPPQENRA